MFFHAKKEEKKNTLSFEDSRKTRKGTITINECL